MAHQERRFLSSFLLAAVRDAQRTNRVTSALGGNWSSPIPINWHALMGFEPMALQAFAEVVVSPHTASA
jgi:hypothetical protein